MGDRTTPMKFGPEWLRNLSREPTGTGGSGTQSTSPNIRPVTSNASASSNTTASPKVQLAKLRYGREEMLALYDRQTAEAPVQLKSIEQLYHSRGKSPYALNSNYEEDAREGGGIRNNPPVSTMSADRFGQGRGRGFGLTMLARGSPVEGRGRARIFARQTSSGSDTFRAPSWHNGAQRSYPGPPDDDPTSSRGLWNNGNGVNPPGIRPSAEQADWANKMAYRKPRQNHTNWRQQHNRDEGEEWRSDGARRGHDKWDREWPERSVHEKGWSSNRRQWGGDADELPEWAVENSEACGGTFDSSGAFHGYSNDDSNIPKAHDSSYALARSQTHGSFAQDFKQFAKRRFDAIEVKFKKPTDESVTEESGNPPSATNEGANATDSGQSWEVQKTETIRNKLEPQEEPVKDCPEMQEVASALPPAREEPKLDFIKARSASAQRNELLRQAEEREPGSEQGTYKSVMMASNNNNLRQQHQNIGSPSKKKQYTQRFQQMLDARKKMESDYEQKQNETKLVEDMLNMQLSEELQTQLLNTTTQSAGVGNSVNSVATQRPGSGMQMRNNPLVTPGVGMNQLQSTPGGGMNQLQTTPGVGINQLQTTPGVGMNQLQTTPGVGMNHLQSTPGMGMNQLQTTPGVGMNQLQTTSGVGMNQLQTTPSMGMNQLQSTSGMGMNQLQTSNSQTQPAPETNMMQSIGMSNSVLNASLGLPVGTGSNMKMPLTSMPPPANLNSGMISTSNIQGMGTGNMPNMQVGGIQNRMQVPVMPATSFQTAMPANNMQGLQPNIQTSNMSNNNMQSVSGMPGYQANSLFMGAPTNNPGEMGNQGQQNMYPMHGHSLQQSASQGSFTPASMYRNMIQPQQPSVSHPNIPLVDLWYYEDPNKTIQGPFTSKEMYGWYHAGFFTPDLLVRRACESGLMPLASYGLMPFGSADIMLPQYNLSRARYDMREHENMMNAQQAGLGPEVESLWSMREPSADDMMWIRQPVQMPHPEEVKTILNNLSMFFWDQPSGSTPVMPETIKDMKTEDEILAQMRGSQTEVAAQNLTFICDAAVSPEEAFTAGTNIAPNLEELQKLIGSDIHRNSTPPAAEPPAATLTFVPPAKHDAVDEKPSEKVDPEVSAKHQPTTKTADAKSSKPSPKVEEKPKIKDIPSKTKAKKVKEEKKEELTESKKEEKKVTEKQSDEPSPPKNKRDDKANKKDLEKEKKEWLKDGFTIVKGAEKKDNKKKEKEEARAAEEAEKKRKEEEKRALEAEKNKGPEPVTRRQQLEQGQRQSQSQEQPPKKAPWSAQSAQTGRDGLALSDIQRLEREKKLEQIKEQHQMMQAIAQQQAAAAQREQQETLVGQLGWAKKKQANSVPGQTLAEIQTEARKQAAAIVAAATVAAREEKRTTPPPVNVMPWGATNGAGFWDCPSSSVGSETQRRSEPFGFSGSSTTSELKSKKKVTVVAPLKKEPSPPKKEVSPSADFDTWCIHVLSNWRDAANIDIPTFVAFLRDIESPYEVKDYVKCYLGDTKEANDFARQFLERRSRMLRVGMVTPSDDLCSPAAALTPRTNSGSDYTEVKSKGNKKTKKNKMLKVDARILGFSVTASEDRINVGDIDTA